MSCATFATFATRLPITQRNPNTRLPRAQKKARDLRDKASKNAKKSRDKASKKAREIQDQWGIASSEGGSQKLAPMDKDKSGGPVAYISAMLFVVFVGSMPLVTHFNHGGSHFGHKGFVEKHGRIPLTKMTLVEIVSLYIWLIGGLYLFTNVLLFQSPHFHEDRCLSLEEAVYVFAQILTTVGYGDIVPSEMRGQIFVGIFVFLALLLIANMVNEAIGIYEERMENILKVNMSRPALDPTSSDGQPIIDGDHKHGKLCDAFMPVVHSFLVFLSFAVVGVLFFYLYPGEGKSIGQGIYMSLITLSTVGFGAFTPSTHAGMVFSAFWMLSGVGSLGAVITSYAAFSTTMKRYEVLMATGINLEEDK